MTAATCGQRSRACRFRRWCRWRCVDSGGFFGTGPSCRCAGPGARTGPSATARIEVVEPLRAGPGRDGFGGRMLTDRNLEIAGQVVELAAELGTTPAAVALAWVRNRPGVASVLIGPRTAGQLAENLAGFTLVLPPEAIARLDGASRPE
ncbi:aldo/keto reductase [Kitasatospora sp. NPDC001540]|uniref:aldo/keto reductase n=1 Tax=Kitasatospora sp. NPDC001540 TaxID=3364014 RepID=UPI0036A2C7F2